MRAAGYIRVSTEEQRNQGFSLSAQRRQITAYCSARGWTLADIYADGGVSGRSLDRPALQRLLQAVSSNGVQAVVITALDRLSRTTRDLLELIEDHFTRGGPRLVSISEGIDPTTPAGEFVLTVLAGLAQLERRQLAERVRVGMQEARRQGKHLGRPPYGSRIGSGGELVPVPEEVGVLQRARRLVRRQGYSATARELGWPVPTLWCRLNK